MDIGRAFSFVFQDPRWVSKIAIGSLLILIPIFGWFVVYGYAMRVLRLVATEGTDLPLPEWDSLGELFVEGFRGFAVFFVWYLPVIGFSICVSFALGGFDAEESGNGFFANCLTLPFQLLIGFVVPAAVARATVERRFGAGLEVAEVIRLVRERAGDYLLLVVMGIVASIVASLGLIAFCIGILVTIFYAVLFQAHLYGQAYYRARGGAVQIQPAPRF